MAGFQAKWIWDESSEFEKNYWLSFRKEFVVKQAVSAQLKITADSRYTLYINGRFVGRGPMRYWPNAMGYDQYDVEEYLTDGANVISVDVNHYATSTSQYIHAPGKLWLQCDIECCEGSLCVCSDDTFTCKRNEAFKTSTSRVNVAQPWVEFYDAAQFDEAYRLPGFQGAVGEKAQIVPGPKAEELLPNDIPELAVTPLYAKHVLSKQLTVDHGISVTVDFKPNFYPQDTSTADKLQLGYIGTVIEAFADIQGIFRLQSKKWPFTEEKFYLNGKCVVMAADQKEAVIELKKGKNLFLLDVSGAYQRFSADLYFDFGKEQVVFCVPDSSENEFFSVGPFESVDIGNIVCADGFSLDWENKQYLQVAQCSDWSELSSFASWVKPICAQNIDWENVKSRAVTKQIKKKLPVLADDYNMIIPNRTSTVISASEEDIEYVIDFGRETSGFFEIDVSVEKRTQFDFVGFEYLDHDHPELPDDLNNSMVYIARPGRNRFQFHRRIGMRYLLMTVRKPAAPVRIFNLHVNECLYPFVEMGSFFCSDQLLTRIWDMSRETLRLCTEDVLVDCPCFEQAYWIGDARNTALVQSYVFGGTSLLKRCLRLTARSLGRSELPECHVPAGVSFVLTAWALLWMMSCRDCYDLSADLDFIKEIFPSVRKTADAFITHINSDDLLEIDAWNMLDWADMDTPFKGVVTHQNGLLVKALRDAAYLAELIGCGDVAQGYYEVAERVKKAINHCLWNEERKAFVDCWRRDAGQSKVVSLQTHVILKLYDCIDEDKLGYVNSYFENYPEDFVKMGSPFISFFKYQMLGQNGRIKEMLDDIRKEWGIMLEHNATTCWETFIGFYQERLTRSYCHAWSTVPCYVMGKYILGVESLAAGFRKIRVKPQTADLEWARGSVPTPFGAIYVDWKITDGCFYLNAEVPEGIETVIEIPESYQEHARVVLNGKTV